MKNKEEAESKKIDTFDKDASHINISIYARSILDPSISVQQRNLFNKILEKQWELLTCTAQERKTVTEEFVRLFRQILDRPSNNIILGPSTFFAEMVLPRKDAEFIIEGLETLYETRFVPRYGARKAKWLFHVEVLKAAFSTRYEGIRKFLLDLRHKPTRK